MGLDGKEGHLPPTLVRQSSVYSLTIDEFQNSLGWRGKDFGSMNMDEFLKNIWNAEESQTAMGTAAATPAMPRDPVASGAGTSNLQRQGSLTFPKTISQKTVDEVWRDMLKEGGSSSGLQGSSQPSMSQKQRQPTFAEITLEEFLLKAGVVWDETIEPRPVVNPSNTTSESSMFYGNVASSGFESNSGIALGYHNSSLGSNPVGNTSTMTNLTMNAGGQIRGPLSGNTPELLSWQGIRAATGTTDPMADSGLMLGMTDLGSNGGRSTDESPGSNIPSDGKGNGSISERGLRRKGNGIVEKVVERRQRRMIKNRESAARSRARKQAYTLELEAEIEKLKEQNEELLKKQAEILEVQKSQVQEKPDQQHESKKRRLRRTSSWPRVD